MDDRRFAFVKQLLGRPLTPSQQRYFAEDPEMKVFSARAGSGMTTALVVDLLSRAVFEPGGSIAVMCRNQEEIAQVTSRLQASLARLEELRPELEWKAETSRRYVLDYRRAKTTIEVRTLSDEARKKKVKNYSSSSSGIIAKSEIDTEFDAVYLHVLSAAMKRQWVGEVDELTKDGGKLVILASTPQDAEDPAGNPDASTLDKVLADGAD